jgi:AraC-like DNA-binding protein
VLSLTENKQSIKKWDWLHFIPAVISIVVLVPLLLQPAEMKIAIIKKFLAGQYASFRFLIVTILSSFIAYLVASTKKLWITIHKENPSHQKILLLLTTVFAWIVLVLLKAVFFLTLSFTLLKISNIMIMITILLVYFVMQRYPTFFLYGTISGSKKQKTKSYLGKIDTANLERELQALMQEEKFYCDEDITLKRLSAALEITPHQLSEFLNSHYNKNFNTYINTFRIKEGKELLLENERRNTLSIAYAVGFNSYTAFYTAFKQATGLSPADFRKKNSH